jgi:hypothetical protein
MSLTIRLPIRNVIAKATPQKVHRGRLYNDDDNHYFHFQFNPIPEPLVEYNWADDAWLGRAETHAQFLGVGQTQFELPLQFIVAPGTPDVENNCNLSPVSEYVGGGKFINIENVIAVIKRWAAIRLDKRRPSLVWVDLPDASYKGRITLIGIRGEDRFPDGRLRRATIRIGFKEWRTINA